MEFPKIAHFLKSEVNNRNLPKIVADIPDDDPHVYLDEEDCLIWMADGEPHYMNSEGGVGVVPDAAYKIIARLGIFRGLAIE